MGVDSSPEMLAKAEPWPFPAASNLSVPKSADWDADQPIDLIVSNAALHWIADHESLLTRLAGMLSPRGTLAVQMPNRFQRPSQAAIEAVAPTHGGVRT